jgi:ABC-type antimicrobial peptide transport system permease subunit
MAYSVAQRPPEIGIRIALDARQTNILKITFREGMSLVLIGLGIGVAFAVVLSHSLASWIYGVRPNDITAYDPVPATAIEFPAGSHRSRGQMIGQPITLNEHDFTVIGVTPQEFGSPFVGAAIDV